MAFEQNFFFLEDDYDDWLIDYIDDNGQEDICKSTLMVFTGE